MEAKDTVKLCPILGSGWRVNCEAKCHYDQAEISFKAGIDVLWKTLQTLGYQRALDDVVLMGKLKEWGVDKPKK